MLLAAMFDLHCLPILLFLIEVFVVVVRVVEWVFRGIVVLDTRLTAQQRLDSPLLLSHFLFLGSLE